MLFRSRLLSSIRPCLGILHRAHGAGLSMAWVLGSFLRPITAGYEGTATSHAYHTYSFFFFSLWKIYCNSPTWNYFFFSTSCSAASFALFARMPKSRALARAIRRLAKALKFFSSSVITLAFSFLYTFRMGITGPVSWVASLSSSAELSPFFGAEGFLGNRMSLERYSSTALHVGLQ